MSAFVKLLQTLNQLLSAGIAITAFSLLLYSLSFNLRDRVVRTFAAILVCVVIVFVGETIASIALNQYSMEIWMKIQWIGLVFLPAVYLHFSDALLATTGRPSRGRRLLLVKIYYGISIVFLILLPSSYLVGKLLIDGQVVPHLERTPLTWVFAVYYLVGMVWAWVNFLRAFSRTLTPTSRRRMSYLIIGALAPALGSYPYLLFGSTFADNHPVVFWVTAVSTNISVSVLMTLMAYAVAFFGVPWPDRVVKRRLFKWLLRGPVTAITVLAVTMVGNRLTARYGASYSAIVPVLMVGTIVVLEYMITILSPYWERWLFYGNDWEKLKLVQAMEERMLTTSDIKQFLESVVTAICDRLQVSSGYVIALEPKGMEFVVTVGSCDQLKEDTISDELLKKVVNGTGSGVSHTSNFRLFSWGHDWLIPLYESNGESKKLLGLIGFERKDELPDEEQMDAIIRLSQRAAIALDDRNRQQMVFNSIETLTPQVDMIQQLRAASRYDGTEILSDLIVPLEEGTFTKWVKDALSHYWGGPKLSQSPLLQLQVVKQSVAEHNGVSANALREILKKGIERVKPTGKRHFTAEWILYNILEMKFMEGRKVREIAMRLAMSEADLYRKQRVAIDAVAKAIVEMEKNARKEKIDDKEENEKPSEISPKSD